MSFISEVTDEVIAQERRKARELRSSQWWKNQKGKGFCYYCKGKVHPSELTMDHVVPVIRGGKSKKGNVVPCCKDCNNKKKHLLPVEWDDHLKSLEKD
ncbi:MAG: HNH endonuclease [Proteobacteria bacterium]|nr:HNH endonuclease [Pseudomonadota bacterium]